MYSKTYSLAFILDRDGWLKEDLITSNSLYKLDEYIKNNFESHVDVRKKYDEKISEFCLNHMDLIKSENAKNHHNATGKIVILENNYNQERLFCMRQIKVIYKGNDLPSRKKCLSKIKNSLEDDSNLEKLYKRKSFLLSRNEMDLIRQYYKHHNDKYKKNAIAFLVYRIREDDGLAAYYSCRHLANLCDLIEPIKKEKKVKVTGINKVVGDNYSLKEFSPYNRSLDDIEVEQMTMDKILRRDGK